MISKMTDKGKFHEQEDYKRKLAMMDDKKRKMLMNINRG